MRFNLCNDGTISNGVYFSIPSLFRSEMKNRVNSYFPNPIGQRHFVPFFEEGGMWKVEGRIQFKVFAPSTCPIPPESRTIGPSGFEFLCEAKIQSIVERVARLRGCASTQALQPGGVTAKVIGG
jgi:hypothetical protein